MTGSSTLMTVDADLPFLSVFKDGELMESMCLSGLESVVLGRHTNCDLMVTHPSVSRHHLEIQVLHDSREFLLTDLDSIHGTWINGKQALPLVPVTAKEGDSIKLGASSRTYAVQWRPRPPQNSTSSEDYSGNSDSPLDCTRSKDHGAADSRTTMESCKPLHLNSQPACSTKSNNFCADNEQKEEESGLGKAEIVAKSLQNDKGGCVNKEMSSLDCNGLQDTIVDAKVQVAVESLANDECISKEKSSLDGDESQDEVNGQQGSVKANNLQVSMEKGKKVMPVTKEECVEIAIDSACFNGDDGGESVQKEKQLSTHEPKEASAALSSLGVDEEDGRESVDFKDSKHFSTQLSSEEANPALSRLCFDAGDVDFQEAKPFSMLESEEANPGLSKLWLRRSKLNPPPNLMTSTSPCPTVPLPSEQNKICLLPFAPPMPLTYLTNNLIPSAPPLPPPVTADDEECVSGDFGFDDAKENNHPSVLRNQEMSGDICPNPLFKSAGVDEEYVSDKENDSPVFDHGCKNVKASKNKAQEESLSQERRYSATTEVSRRPFQPLTLTADGGCKQLSPCFKNLSGEENSTTQTRKRPSPVIQNLDLMLRKLKGVARSEPRRAWHIVADITCFLDSSSFQSLKQLEGLREVRLIIPKIVISELDSRRGIGRPRRKALKWIEACMIKLPSWIHVQSSSENLPAAATPPVSPLSASSIYSGNFDNMISPTNGDHVLNCAILFNNTVFSGQVALITNDLALKIKAMAEGLVCESPSTFCESLLSPYSSRFLWATSIAHGNSWTEKPFHSKSMFALAPSVQSGDQSTKEVVISTVKAMAFRKNHAVEGLKKQCCKQAQGLRVALAN